jgi:hypothetical protein
MQIGEARGHVEWKGEEDMDLHRGGHTWGRLGHMDLHGEEGTGEEGTRRRKWFDFFLLSLECAC